MGFRRTVVSRTVVMACLVMATAAAAATPFEIIVFGDPQNYNDNVYSHGRNQLVRQSEWVVDNLVKENIAFVTVTGDNANTGGNAALQRNASNAYGPLAGVVPYSLAFGNHDFYSDATAANARQFYGASRFQDAAGVNLPWYGGTADPAGPYASVTNMVSYQTFSAGGYDFLHINLPMLSNAGQTNAITVAQKADALAWARSIAAAHPNMPTILTTHELLETTAPDAINTEVMNGLLKDNPQIFMTLCGHNHGQYDQVTTITDTSGSHNVLQVLVDYQDVSDGGGSNGAGYLKKIIFDKDNGKISFQTYSPSQNVFMNNTTLGTDRSNFSYGVTFTPSQIVVPGGAARMADATPAAPATASLKGRYTQSFNGFGRVAGVVPPQGWTVWEVPGASNAMVSTVTTANAASATQLANATMSIYDGTNRTTSAFGVNAGAGSSDYDRALGSCPTSIGGKVLQLNLVNDTGAPIRSLAVGYERRELSSSANHIAEELPGYWVFYSTDNGATWTSTTLNTTRAAYNGSVASENGAQVARGILRFSSPVAANSSLLLRWVDDNSQTISTVSEDNNYSVDNFSALTGAPLTGAGYFQNFNAMGRAGTNLPAGWSIWNIKGAAGDILNTTANATLASSWVPTATPTATQTLEVVSERYAQNSGALSNASFQGSNTSAGYSADVAINIQVGAAAAGNRAVATTVGLVAAKVIELAITCDTATPVTRATFSFDVLQPYVAPADEANSLLGYRTFYSRDGATWTAFQLYKDGGGALVDPAAAGTYAVDLDFTGNPLAANDMLLFRWLDDNQSTNGGGDEHTWAIDNVGLAVAPVPEPSALGFLGVGLAGLVWRRRRRSVR